MINRLKAAAVVAVFVATSALAVTGTAQAAPVRPGGTPTVSKNAAHPAGVPLNSAKGVTKGRPGVGRVTNSTTTPCSGSAPGNCYHYTEMSQDFTADPVDSAAIAFRVENTYLPRTANNNTTQNASHTLEEMAVSANSGDIVEIGVSHDPNVNTAHPNDPSLFVFPWVGGTPGTYNGSNGWTNAPGCSPCVGDSLASLIGTTHSFGWQYFGAGSGATPGWWAFMDTSWLGVYPDAAWGGGFTTGRTVQVFGELAGTPGDQVESCGDIGSGDLAAAGTVGGRASGFNVTGTTIAPSFSLGTVTDATRWNVFQTSPTSFNFGGPGYNSIGQGVGVKGSCAPATAGTAPAGTFQLFKEACPDLTTTTGCNLGQGFTTGNTTVGVCTPITGQPNTITYAVKNNAGVSGRTYSIFHTSNCTGTSRTYGNQGGEAYTFGVWGDTNIKAIKRNN